jgi:squalene-associated FAD-dependent desaturase
LSRPDVLVIGGGLAGITAALDCADAGASVTLVEVRRRLGGAAYSVQRDGLCLDNGQHVFLRCCTAYRRLLGRLKSDSRISIQRRLEIPVLSPNHPAYVLRRGFMPAPLHLASALLRYPHLAVSQRWRAALAARALARVDPGDPLADEQTLGGWLSEHGQGPQALQALWDLIALPALNVPAAEASLALGAFVFRTGLLSSAGAGDIGFHSANLQSIIGDPALRALTDAGVRVELGWRAAAIDKDRVGFRVRQDSQQQDAGSGQEPIQARTVIVALPHARAGSLLRTLASELTDQLAALQSSPIVNLHVLYDRPVMDLPFAAGVGTPVQYLFDRTEAGGAPPDGQYLAVSLSAAEQQMQMSADQLRACYLPALERLLPAARSAKVEHFLVSREHAATFRASPGTGRLRCGPRTSVPGLVMAGAWTATGWPATLEGAVLSGHAAATQALESTAPSARSTSPTLTAAP